MNSDACDGCLNCPKRPGAHMGWRKSESQPIEKHKQSASIRDYFKGWATEVLEGGRRMVYIRLASECMCQDYPGPIMRLRIKRAR